MATPVVRRNGHGTFVPRQCVHKAAQEAGLPLPAKPKPFLSEELPPQVELPPNEPSFDEGEEVKRYNETYRQLQKSDRFYRLIKLFGLGDAPSRIFKGEVSRLYKINSWLHCFIAIYFTVECIYYSIFPERTPHWQSAVSEGQASMVVRWIMPIVHTGGACIRVATCLVLNSSSFSREFRQCYIDIYNDPYLRTHSVKPWRQWLGADGPVVVSIGTVTSLFIFWYFATSSVQFPGSILFYVNLVQLFTALLYAGCFCAGVSLNAIVPLMQRTSSLFEQSVQTEDIALLEAAIVRHDHCVSLVRCMDRIMRHLLGIFLSILVPTFSLIVGTASEFGHAAQVLNTVRWIVMATLGMIVITYCASKVHSESHRPDDILSDNVPKNAEFQRKAAAFRGRFANRSTGYTFFGFSVLDKKTVLTVLNLASTYLIVTLQFQDNKKGGEKN